jgi:hypothetical protein
LKQSPKERCDTDLEQSIKVIRVSDGWVWMLIDDEGRVRADGAAVEQQEAMEAAWRTAKSSSDGQWRQFPEIVVEQNPAACCAPIPRPGLDLRSEGEGSI